MATTKFREIKIRPNVILPAISTDQGERPYAFLDFLGEWIVGARGMRKEENLPHLFEWEETIEEFASKMATKAGVTEPKLPATLMAPDPVADAKVNEKNFADHRKAMVEIQSSYNEDGETYRRAICRASVGENIYVTDAAYRAAKEAAKDALDEACTAGSMAASMHAAYQTKVLRHYHALTQSKAVDEKDVPRGETLSANGAGQAAELSA